MSINSALLVGGFVLSAAATVTIMAGWLPLPAWLRGSFGGVAVYAVAALTVLLGFLSAWSLSGRR